MGLAPLASQDRRGGGASGELGHPIKRGDQAGRAGGRGGPPPSQHPTLPSRRRIRRPEPPPHLHAQRRRQHASVVREAGSPRPPPRCTPARGRPQHAGAARHRGRTSRTAPQQPPSTMRTKGRGRSRTCRSGPWGIGSGPQDAGSAAPSPAPARRCWSAPGAGVHPDALHAKEMGERKTKFVGGGPAAAFLSLGGLPRRGPPAAARWTEGRGRGCWPPAAVRPGRPWATRAWGLAFRQSFGS